MFYEGCSECTYRTGGYALPAKLAIKITVKVCAYFRHKPAAYEVYLLNTLNLLAHSDTATTENTPVSFFYRH